MIPVLLSLLFPLTTGLRTEESYWQHDCWFNTEGAMNITHFYGQRRLEANCLLTERLCNLIDVLARKKYWKPYDNPHNTDPQFRFSCCVEQGGKGLASLDYAEEEVFLCGDHICVNSSSVCDGRIDCHNGADEHHDCPGPYLSQWVDSIATCDHFCGPYSDHSWPLNGSIGGTRHALVLPTSGLRKRTPV
ncbi:uncharacterized protein LOC142348271 isoform X2 [Convolutriloba macropyga]|uniref:uncharacterized protein LOC142348271 isoform X2 n=1 Tax=Convolutriloba macropyga TaxID=536237 RepID=UPI003F525D51